MQYERRPGDQVEVTPSHGCDQVEVTPSCGCVFCDLGLRPEMRDGRPMHDHSHGSSECARPQPVHAFDLSGGDEIDPLKLKHTPLVPEDEFLDDVTQAVGGLRARGLRVSLLDVLQ